MQNLAITCVNIGVKLIRIGFDQRGLCKLCIVVEVLEPYEIIKGDGGQDEYDGKVPEVELKERR